MHRLTRVTSLATLLAIASFGSASAADLLVSSAQSNQVLRFNGATGAPLGAFVAPGANGLAGPAGLAFNSVGDLHVAAGGPDAVLRYDGLSGAAIDAFATTDMDQPAGIAIGRDGHLYVASRADHRVLRYAGGTGDFIDAFVAAGSGGLVQPTGIAFGPDGHLYVSSFGTDRVLRYDGTTGAFMGVFATGSLAGPQGLAFGADGHLYVASFTTNRVLRYNGATGALIGAFVGTNNGGLNGPIGIVFGLDGNLYVASSNSNQILRYNKATGAPLAPFVGAGSGGLSGPTYLMWNPVKVVHPTPGQGHYTTIQAAVNDIPAAGPRIIRIRSGTYPEAVTISRRNASAVTESQRVILMADPAAAPGSVIVTPPRDRNTFSLDQSRFITLRGLTLTGATREAIYIRGGGATNRDLDIDGNDLHHNGSASANGGIYIGRENPRTWVFNNVIRSNGRNGVLVDCGLANAPKYFVNNTIVQNGFNGLFLGDALKDEIFLVNNLIAANGTAAGTTGGRFGVLRESTAPGTGPGARGILILRRNLFYANVGGDIGNVIQTLDSGDEGNFTTRGNEAPSCYQGAAGCVGAIAGCAFGDCGAAHTLDEIFADSSAGDFRLAATSPALGRGQNSLFQSGAERVPADDVDGDPRADPPAIGFDEPR